MIHWAAVATLGSVASDGICKAEGSRRQYSVNSIVLYMSCRSDAILSRVL
jgi:hypothetical protein